MSDLVLQSILLGLALSFFIGPVFFYLIETAINKGIAAALGVSIGVIFSDAVCIAIVYGIISSGASYLFNSTTFQEYFSQIGGSILFIFGLVTAFRRKETIQRKAGMAMARAGRFISAFGKGFILNIVNPSVFLFWSVSIAITLPQYQGNIPSIFSFFVLTLLTVFLIDVFKILISKKISFYLNSNILLWMSRISGWIFMVFGLVLVIKPFFQS